MAGIARLLRPQGHCFVWMDYVCLDQDSAEVSPVEALEGDLLERVFRWSDCMFTPLVDQAFSSWTYEPSAEGHLADYKAQAWNGGDHAYVSRAWCRLEMIYNASVPVSGLCEQLAASLAPRSSGSRPHFLFGDRERSTDAPPIALAPVAHVRLFMLKFNPLKGALSVGSDLPHVRRLLEHVLALAGARDKVVACTLPNGDEYEGGWSNGHMSGWGRLRCVSGDAFEGQFLHGLFEGAGSYQWHNGDSYLGDFKGGLKHGKGRFCRPSKQEEYEGGWKEDVPAGRGVFTLSDGLVFECEDATSGAGQCKIRWPNGDHYQGQFTGLSMHGKGRFVFADGRMLEGYFARDKYVGYGPPSSKGCCIA